MKKITAFLMSCALVFGLAACSFVQASQNGGTDGSSERSSQATTAQATADEDTAAQASTPIDFQQDNPLGDAEIASVVVRMYGVGDKAITGDDEQTIKDIIQNDAREWQDLSGYDYIETFPEDMYMKMEEVPLHLVVTLASGESYVINAYKTTDTSGFFDILTIEGEDYKLSYEEYQDFASIVQAAREEIVAGAPESVKPFADLTKDDISHITRVGQYYEMSPFDKDLTDDQVDQVISTLNSLEIEPASVEYEPVEMNGGSYGYFVIHFDNGEYFRVGSHTAYPVYDDSGKLTDMVSVAYIDGVVYRCNKEYAEDINWDHQETRDGYVKMYLSGRKDSDYLFENLTVEEITGISVGIDNNGTLEQRMVPLNMAEKALEVLKQIRYADDNKLERPDLSFGESVDRSSLIEIKLNDQEVVKLGIDDGHLVFNQWDYSEDPEMIAALEDLIAEAKQAAEEMLAAAGETQQVRVDDDTELKGMLLYGDTTYVPRTSYMAFEIPALLVEHEDGYYPEGYTLDDAPISVTVTKTANDGSDGVALKRFDDAVAAGEEGYSERDVQVKSGSTLEVYEYRGSDGYDREILFVARGIAMGLEIHVVCRDSYDITPDAIYALIFETFVSGYVTMD